jgi:hypothetical protein
MQNTLELRIQYPEYFRIKKPVSRILYVYAVIAENTLELMSQYPEYFTIGKAVSRIL